MPPITHQTVRLARGRHASPRDGVCAMELASMLAGESFSDRPHCVSPALGGLLRAYNDLIDDRRRQDLYAAASAVVGTRADAATERARVARVAEWGRAMRRRRCLMGLPGREPAPVADVDPDAAGVYAIRALGRRRAAAHSEVLALVDELVAMSDPRASRGLSSGDPDADPDAAVRQRPRGSWQA